MAKSFKVTDLAAVPVDNKLDLRIRYENPDANNSGIAFKDNMAVIKAVVAKYPELREAFDSDRRARCRQQRAGIRNSAADEGD